jgi:hypothetical protein
MLHWRLLSLSRHRRGYRLQCRVLMLRERLAAAVSAAVLLADGLALTFGIVLATVLFVFGRAKNDLALSVLVGERQGCR